MKEVEFGYRIRQALNEGTERLPYRVVMRLEQARKTALARQKAGVEGLVWVAARRFAPQGGGLAALDEPTGPWLWLGRLGLVAPMIVALVVGFVGIYQWQQDQAIAEIAEHANMDLAVLLDDTPIDTYADQGFGVMLRNDQGI
jgi:hypothetical protein